MLRNSLLAIAILTITACHSSQPDTPEAVFLSKLKPVIDSERLDYATVRQLFGAPLYTSDKFEMASNGSEITSMKGDYYVKDKDSPPGLDSIRFDMAWDLEKGRPSTVTWGAKEKGMNSSLRISFDTKQLCITKSRLLYEWGMWDSESPYTDVSTIGIVYGDYGDKALSATFDFEPDDSCARSVSLYASDSGGKWVTPSDITASDAEFITKMLPLDKSGTKMLALGMSCEPDTAKNKDSKEIACGCDRERQTNKGPCHHAVSFEPEPNGDIKTVVYILRNEEANRE